MKRNQNDWYKGKSQSTAVSIQSQNNFSKGMSRDVISLKKNQDDQCIFCRQNNTKVDNYVSQCLSLYCVKQHLINNQLSNVLKIKYPQMHSKLRERETAVNQEKQKYTSNPLLLMRSSLYQKFAQSQNYFFTRDVNEILSEAVSKNTIRYKDYLTYDEQDEYLKRAYQLQEYPSKIYLLAEYYKFHTDIPRIFVEPTNEILNKYYDKRRKCEYYRIAKIIEDENQRNPQRPPKGIVGERPSPINSQEVDDDDGKKNVELKETYILKDLSGLNQSHSISNNQQISIQDAKTQVQRNVQKEIKQKKLDQSQTLSEICKNLNNQNLESRVLHENTFLAQNFQDNENVKLNNFLKFMKTLQEKQEKQQQKVSQLPPSQQVKIKLKSQENHQGDLLTKITRTNTISDNIQSRQSSQEIKSNKSPEINQQNHQMLGIKEIKKDSPSSKCQTTAAFASKFQVDLLNLENYHNRVPSGIQSARAQIPEFDLLENKQKNLLRNTRNIPVSHNVSPQNKILTQMKKVDQKNIVKSISREDLQKLAKQKKDEKLNPPKLAPFNQIKPAKLQMPENPQDSSQVQSTKEINHLHQKPKAQNQNLFTCTRNTSKQTIDQGAQHQRIQQQKETLHTVQALLENKKHQVDFKKLSLGSIDHMQTVQTQPILSNRSHQPSKSNPMQYLPVPLQSARAINHQGNRTTINHQRQHSDVPAFSNEQIRKQYIQEFISQTNQSQLKKSHDFNYVKDQFMNIRDTQISSEPSTYIHERGQYILTQQNSPRAQITKNITQIGYMKPQPLASNQRFNEKDQKTYQSEKNSLQKSKKQLTK